MPHRPPRPARLALLAVKMTVVGSIAVVGWANQSVANGAAGPDAGYADGYAGYAVADQPSRADHLLDRHDCSVTGFDDGSQPLSAVVRTGSGRLRFVSFDTGWRVFTSHGPASLVAVCLDEPPGGQAP